MFPPLHPKAWDYSKAAHLLNRAGFGGTPAEIEAFHALGFEGALDKILTVPDDSAHFPPPDWAQPRNMVAYREEGAAMVMKAGEPSETQKARLKEYRRESREHLAELIEWWLRRMKESQPPLREKMTLFWHGHFATSAEKVRDAYYMWLQNETLRRNALGNFGTMVKAMLIDPAMLEWLDTDKSRSFKPNENFARELMELFTLGVGNYTEADIQQSARAFTGYRINPASQTGRFSPLQHDDGEKVFLGQKGHFNGDQIIDIILQQPVCARYMAGKLWTFFAYENPSPDLVESLAKTFRESRYEIRPLMRTIFQSEEFYSHRAIRTQIKSPVQWMVNTTKVLETSLPATTRLAAVLRQLGQVPFMPPNVKGGDGGKSWITTATLLDRYNLAGFVVGNGVIHVQRPGANLAKAPVKAGREVTSNLRLDFGDFAPPALRNDPKGLVASLTLRLFQSPLKSHDTEPFVEFLKGKQITDKVVAELLQLMMSTPQYQLT